MSGLERWEDTTEELLFVPGKVIDGHEAIAEMLEHLARRWRERLITGFSVHCVEGGQMRVDINFRPVVPAAVLDLPGELEIAVRRREEGPGHLSLVVEDERDNRPTPPLGIGTVSVRVGDEDSDGISMIELDDSGEHRHKP